jgi:hypothetical protein
VSSKIKRFEDRVHKLDPTDTPESRAHAEGQAYMAWVNMHLTEDEQMQLAHAIKASDDGGAMGEDAHAILLVGEERAGKEPSSACEEFKTKHMRVEALRHGNHPMTELEHDELVALNAWFDDSSDAFAAKFGLLVDWVRGPWPGRAERSMRIDESRKAI